MQFGRGEDPGPKIIAALEDMPGVKVVVKVVEQDVADVALEGIVDLGESFAFASNFQ